MQQWGYFYESQSDTDYRHFPVAFTTFLLPVLGKAYYLTTEPDGYVPYIEYLGSNNFLCGFGNNRSGNAYVPIMVIGKQQWGYNLATPGNGTTYNLLITCSDFNLGYISNSAGAGEICGCEVTLTTIQLSRTTHSNTLCWAALGKQQWGSYLESQSDTDYRHFSIAYTTFYKIALGNVDYSVSEPVYGYTPYFQEVNSNTFLIGYGNNREGYGYVPLIAIGQQQWGYTHIQNTTTTINLPISFTQGFTLVCVTSVTTRGSWAAGKLINNAQAAIGSRGADFYTAEDVGWIASGMYKQQWGYLSFSAVVTAQKVITYPIALSEIALPVAIAIAENSGNDAGLAINNDCMGNHYSSCEFNVISYGTQRCVGIIFVVIGKQQWGTYPGNHTLTFAVAFTVPWVLVLNGLTGTAEDRLNTETTLQPNTNVLHNDDPPGGYYIAIGQQQIKRRRYHYRDHTRLFLQIVYRHHKYQWHHY